MTPPPYREAPSGTPSTGWTRRRSNFSGTMMLYVWSESGQAFTPKKYCTHSETSCCGEMVKVDGLMRKEESQYSSMISVVLRKTSRWVTHGSYTMTRTRSTQPKIVTQWFHQTEIGVLEWPPQNPVLDPIENLRTVPKSRVRPRKPSFSDGLSGIASCCSCGGVPEACTKWQKQNVQCYCGKKHRVIGPEENF